MAVTLTIHIDDGEPETGPSVLDGPHRGPAPGVGPAAFGGAVAARTAEGQATSDELAVKDAVIRELVKALKALGAGGDLLGVACSYGETYTDRQVLDELRHWNETEGAATGGGRKAPGREGARLSRLSRLAYLFGPSVLKGDILASRNWTASTFGGPPPPKSPGDEPDAPHVVEGK